MLNPALFEAFKLSPCDPRILNPRHDLCAPDGSRAQSPPRQSPHMCRSKLELLSGSLCVAADGGETLAPTLIAISYRMSRAHLLILPSRSEPVEFIENHAGCCWAEKYLNHFLTMHGKSLQIQLLGTVAPF